MATDSIEGEDRGLGEIVTFGTGGNKGRITSARESLSNDPAPSETIPLTSQEQYQVERAAQKLQSRRSSDCPSCKPWHNVEKHEQHRSEMVGKVSLLLRQRKKSPSDQWLKQLPIKAKKLEHKLYHAAKSFEEYIDPHTLKYRLVSVVQHFVQDYKSSSALMQHRKSTRSTTRSSQASTSTMDAPLPDDEHGEDTDTDNKLSLPRSSKMRRQLSNAIENDKEVNVKLQEQLMKAIQRNAATLELMQANTKSSLPSESSSTSAPMAQPSQQQPQHSETDLTERLLLQQQKEEQALLLQQNWLTSQGAPSLLNTTTDLSSIQNPNHNALTNLLRQQHALQGGNSSTSNNSSLAASSQLAQQQQQLRQQQLQQQQHQLSDTVRLQASFLSNSNLMEQQRRCSLLQNDVLLERQRQIQLLLLEANANGNTTGSANTSPALNHNSTDALSAAMRLGQLQQRRNSTATINNNVLEPTSDLGGDNQLLSQSPFDW